MNLNKKISIYPNLESRKANEEFNTYLPYVIEKEDIPKDAHEFYQDFGYLTHSRTGEIIKRLTDYQYEIWNCPAKTVLVDKSQKSGLTTSELIHDFQECLLSGKGKDLLVIGQTMNHAIEHLYTLKRLIMDSEKYRKYLITKSNELLFREEQTKTKFLYIKNTDNPYRPTRIIALPFNQGAIWSWKQVFRIHVSDPAAAPIVDDAPVYAAAFSRLTNTDGHLMIEGPPAGPYGRFYELHEQFKDNRNPDFQVFHVTIYQARDNGLVTQEFIDEKKIELGPLFSQTYEASFEVGVGNVFDPQSIDKAIELGKKYSVEKIPIDLKSPKVYGCDFGFSSSATSIIGFEHMRNQLREGTIKEDIIRVIGLHYIQRGNPQEISDLCWNIYKQHGHMNTWFYCDSSNAGMINLLKGRWDENVKWVKTKDVSPHSNKIIPISFNGDNHKQMLSRMHLIVSKGKLAIDPKYEKLIISMRTAIAEGLSLQKDKTAWDDVLDSCRVGLVPFDLY